MSLATLLSEKINAHPPQRVHSGLNSYACVAAILRGSTWQQLELAFIRRTTRNEDRWSGQVAFPGGRAETSDSSDRATAIRETLEEIGFDLQAHECLGTLDDIQARKAGQLLDFFIRPFVFYVEREVPVKLGSFEVADFFWVPLQELIAPNTQIQYELVRENIRLNLPAIQMKTEPPLWGLTYMMTQNLLKTLGMLAEGI